MQNENHKRYNKANDVLNEMRQLLQGEELVKLRTDKIEREQKALEEKENVIREKEDVLARKERSIEATTASLLQLKTALRIGLTFSDTDKDRTDWILGCPEVARWLDADHSRVLVVNAKEAIHETNSTASFFSALLLATLRDGKRPPVLLYWFCGQNTERNVQSMLKAVIGQLLNTGLPTGSPPVPDDESELHFEDLVQFLVGCIRAQTSETPVFCVMDSASCYEDRERVRDLEYLCKELTELVRDAHLLPNPFKIMATSPVQCTCLGAHPGKFREILTVPEVTEGAPSYNEQLGLVRSREAHVVAGG